MYKFTLYLFALATSGMSFASSHNQLSIGFSDLVDFDQGFFGVGYQYYFDDLDKVDGPHLLKSHLNQINTAEVSGFSTDKWHYINLSSTLYFEDEYILELGGSRFTDKVGRAQQKDEQYQVKFGKFFGEKVQVGLSFHYLRDKDEYLLWSEDGQQFKKTIETEFMFAPFIRYTAIENNQGWDFSLQPIAGKKRYYQGRASYYMNQRWSFSALTLIRSNDVSKGSIELQTEYWFADRLSFKFGLGSNIGDFSQLNSASLLLTLRF
ncbi:hypothetical protein [Pseudoalteromonas tunicata]|uniref:Orphan protein n=1 Tax=Pseudoalteromonas tunicata D2 TaxID=87626 RepID=A4CDD3_9GAMM|nr:hypothetical protein [Pseudoalteromonas tunicata]ATC94081.1 hypothetical protein PTUN_a1454 [Pseudoalteromonas tunicata]AXT29862.1 hypothetical protein D1819_02810 [Pseudoalteromonas tunicata]EAR27576.1 hypothetical protein PTD2_16092 [Pseudoalteromonas tunicata D2]MDP4983907.1 hypothetical protein [Pseudoalteromonas tunicata]MDP5213813.1 hypothetical protein [Pseudoalteromonas tunicata]